jgi:hypothetical protein
LHVRLAFHHRVVELLVGFHRLRGTIQLSGHRGVCEVLPQIRARPPRGGGLEQSRPIEDGGTLAEAGGIQLAKVAAVRPDSAVDLFG